MLCLKVATGIEESGIGGRASLTPSRAEVVLGGSQQEWTGG